jgi:hypothetical protein
VPKVNNSDTPAVLGPSGAGFVESYGAARHSKRLPETVQEYRDEATQFSPGPAADTVNMQKRLSTISTRDPSKEVPGRESAR